MAAVDNIDKIKLRFDVTPEEIRKLSEAVIADYDAAVESVVKAEPSFDAVIGTLGRAEAKFQVLHSITDFPQYVSPSKELRDASSDADKKISEYIVEVGMREDFAKAVQRYAGLGEPLEGEDARFLDRMLRDFRRNGLTLPADKRAELMEVKKRISELAITFQKNLNEDTSSIQVPRSALAGLPDDFVNSLEVASGQEDKAADEQEVIVTCKYPHAIPTMKQCTVEETRRKMEFAFANRCKEANTPIAEEVFALRDKAAKILGYQTWAQYILEIRMAKTPERVQAFYDDLRPKLETLADKELEVLLELKKADAGDKFDGKINAWDFSFYSTKLLREKYGVDEEAIKMYFPTDRVVGEVLKVYQELLGLRFETVPNAPKWHEEVSCYQVLDSESGELQGFFYLDLYPRDGKYGHAAAFPLQAGGFDENGNKQYSVSAMVCNFGKATGTSPALLRHSETVTFFHEFGHIMHGVLGHTKYSRFAGTSVERDFVEAPSQALENWCWQKDILQRLSEHHETKDSLPNDIIDKMLKAKKVNSGLLNLRQVFFGVFDQAVHSRSEVTSEELYGKLRTEVTRVQHTPNTNPTANFGHLLGGYDSSYFGYLWAEVFSADIFAKFEQTGVMNRDTGMQYRKVILSRGGSDDAENYLREFLGREPNNEAFLKSIGV